MEKQDKQVSLNINDGDSFYANEISMNFNPTNVFIDFKSITPRIDPRSQNAPTFNMKHNVIILEPYSFKQMAGLMNDIVAKYEKEFGKIEKSKILEKMEKKSKKQENESKKVASIPAYLG